MKKNTEVGILSIKEYIINLPYKELPRFPLKGDALDSFNNFKEAFTIAPLL